MSQPQLVGDGRYELEDPVGSGGSATVYRARDRSTGEACAVKILLAHAASSDRTRVRFLHEARATLALDHPNIVRVFDPGGEQAPYYYAMELATGGTLAGRVRAVGSLSLSEALDWTFQVLCGLHHAHANGVIHRDVKPQNLLIARVDGRLRLKLTDFGICRWDAHATQLTGAGDALGTVAYMAPEQRVDPRSAGPQADLYSVGATLYLLITRRRPIDVVVSDQDPSVFERIPPGLRPLIRRATARRVEDRFASAHEMAEAVIDVWAEVDPAIDPAAQRAAFTGG
ncbi:MAG: serine/threonine-protein kinase [Myxococcota bacterium]